MYVVKRIRYKGVQEKVRERVCAGSGPEKESGRLFVLPESTLQFMNHAVAGRTPRRARSVQHTLVDVRKPAPGPACPLPHPPALSLPPRLTVSRQFQLVL